MDLYSDPFQVADICNQKGVYVLSVTTTPNAWNGTKKLSIGHNRIKTSLGLHPQLAHQRYNELELFDSILPNAKYIGEIGLDGSKEFKEHWSVQLKVFRHILKSVSRNGGRIMSLHSRSCVSALLDELDIADGIPILHWFTGNKDELKKAIDRGCWFSVGPAMLKSKKGKELVALIPKNRVLTETDGPFTRNSKGVLMPWDVRFVCSDLSKIWGGESLDVESQVDLNFKNILLIGGKNE